MRNTYRCRPTTAEGVSIDVTGFTPETATAETTKGGWDIPSRPFLLPFPIGSNLCSTAAMNRPSAETSAVRTRDRLTSHKMAPDLVTLVKLRAFVAAFLALLLTSPALADTILLRPARVFDGVNPQPHEGWSVLVEGDKIAAAGPNVAAPAGAQVVELPGATLLPGMIEGHSHLFLHPYNETLWDDQVLHEPLALRTARAVVQAERTLEAGFTTERDLGTEGAGFADVGLKQAIDQGIVPGPRLLVSTKAIVARGAYGPKGFEPGVPIPQGAQEVAGVDETIRAVRDQVAAGADIVKFYADYRWGKGEPTRVTLSQAELDAGVAAAHDAGREVAVHATTAEGMMRAVRAGADTIEHGYGGSAAVFQAMRAKGIALCPTLGASEAYAR